MWRGLYHDHYLLGAKKDTMPRRKWFKVISGATLSSLFASSSSPQQISPTAIGTIPVVPVIDDAGAPESWEGSHQISPFSLVNVSTGNLFTQIPIVSFSGRGFSVSLSLFHNSASTSSLEPFGYGWSHSYNWKIQQDNQGNAIVVRGTRRKHLYTPFIVLI